MITGDAPTARRGPFTHDYYMCMTGSDYLPEPKQSSHSSGMYSKKCFPRDTTGRAAVLAWNGQVPFCFFSHKSGRARLT